jgi:hypothetical protein
MFDMRALCNYVRQHTRRVESTADVPAAFADLVFFKVTLDGSPQVSELKRLMTAHPAEFESVNPLDGREHSFVELGGWLGDQGVALDLMGLGALLGLWQLLTPVRMLGPDVTPEAAERLAGFGLISIVAYPAVPH